MDDFTQRAIHAALHGAVPHKTNDKRPPSGLAHSVVPRQQVRESIRSTAGYHDPEPESPRSWGVRSDIRGFPSRPPPHGLNTSSANPTPGRAAPPPPTHVRPVSSSPSTSSPSHFAPPPPQPNEGDLALAMLRQQLNRLSSRVGNTRQSKAAHETSYRTSTPSVEGGSSPGEVVLSPMTPHTTVSTNRIPNEMEGPLRRDVYGYNHHHTANQGGTSYPSSRDAPVTALSSAEGVFLRKMAELETKVSHHLNQHVLERAKAMRAGDQAREAVDDCEFKLSEVEAIFDSRSAAMRERLESRLSTLETLRRDSLTQFRTRISADLRSLISEYGFETEIEDDTEVTAMESKEISHAKTTRISKRSVLSTVAKQRAAARDLHQMLGQFSAHSDAQMAALQVDLGSRVDKLQEQLRGAQYVAYRSEDASSATTEGRDTFLATVDFVRKALSALRIERHEFETKFIDRIAHITVEGKGESKGVGGEVKGKLRKVGLTPAPVYDEDDGVVVRGSLAKRLYHK